jgi:hypothetical protein
MDAASAAREFPLLAELERDSTPTALTPDASVDCIYTPPKMENQENATP